MLTLPAAAPMLAVTLAVSVTGVPAATLVGKAVSPVAVATWHALELNNAIAGLVSARNRGIGSVALAADAATAVKGTVGVGA